MFMIEDMVVLPFRAHARAIEVTRTAGTIVCSCQRTSNKEFFNAGSVDSYDVRVGNVRAIVEVMRKNVGMNILAEWCKEARYLYTVFLIKKRLWTVGSCTGKTGVGRAAASVVTTQSLIDRDIQRRRIHPHGRYRAA